jgi:hypothetical protein
MNVDLVRATFKSKNLKQLDNLLELINRKYGQQNVVALTPFYIVRARIYILDLEVRIPKVLFGKQQYTETTMEANSKCQ